MQTLEFNFLYVHTYMANKADSDLVMFQGDKAAVGTSHICPLLILEYYWSMN